MLTSFDPTLRVDEAAPRRLPFARAAPYDGRIGNGRDEFLSYLDALGSYLDAGIADYLRENGLATYLEIGGLDHDLEVRRAVLAIRNFVMVDEFPWWNERTAVSQHRAPLSSGD